MKKNLFSKDDRYVQKSPRSNAIKTILILILILMIQFHLFGQENIWSYLEKHCPDSIPEVFLPGIVSTKHHEHSSPDFDPDGKYIYWTTVHDLLKVHTIYNEN